MGKIVISILLILQSAFIAVAQTPDFSMIGYAAMEGEGAYYNQGGTTGGEGGQVVTPTSFAELKRYVEDASTPYIILIDREFTSEQPCYVISSTGALSSKDTQGATLSTYGEVLRIGSNKSIIGVGDMALFNRIGLNVNTQSNIIIRNIRFTFNGVPTSRDGEMKVIAMRDGKEVLVGDPDCLSIQADINSASKDYAHHFWIDHCEFFNGDAAFKDRYDGLLDIKNNVQFVTISWCKFHNHDKACLSGKGNSDDYPRTVTMHHNHFKDIEGSRLPLQRGGMYHYFNNFIENCQDGYDLRAKAKSYIEGCYFKDTKAPVMPSGEGEGATISDLIFENCRRIPAEYAEDGVKYDQLYTIPSSDYRPEYNYKAYLHKASEVPAIVPGFVGVGVIDDEYSSITGKAPVVKIISPAQGEAFNYPASINLSLNASDDDGHIVKIDVYVNNILKNTLLDLPYSAVFDDLSAGIHNLMVRVHDNDGNITTATTAFIIEEYKQASVTTLPATKVGADKATLNGGFEANSQTIDAKGFLLFIGDQLVEEYEILTIGQTSMEIFNLLPETSYSYKAYIIVESETKYAESVSFTTLEEGSVPDEDIIPSDILINSSGNIPSGFSLSFDQTPYVYDQTAIDAQLISVVKGDHSITLPVGCVVTAIKATACANNNTDGKGDLVIDGKTMSLPGRKSEYGVLSVSDLNITGRIDFTLTYDAGIVFELKTDVSSSIENSTDVKELVDIRYYSIDGVQKTATTDNGVTIVIRYFSDGTRSVEKVSR